MIRVFLCVMDVEFLKELVNLNHEDDIEIVGFSILVPKGLDFLLELQVDALVIRDAIHVKRANALTEKIRNLAMYQHIHVIHIFKEIDGCTFHTLAQSDVMNFLLEPYSAKDVFTKIKAEIDLSDRGELARFIEECGSAILIENGIPENLKGFTYMKTAVFVMVHHKTRIVMNKVYHEVAIYHDTTAESVEKAIRLAIQTGYKNHPDCLIYNHKKPTNGEVLRMLIELLKIHGMLV